VINVTYMKFVCTLCALTHLISRHILSKLSGTFYGSQCVTWPTRILHVRLRVHGMRVGARTCEHVCVRTLLDVFALKLVKTSISVGYMHFTSALACTHYARTMRALCAHYARTMRALCAHHTRACTARMCALTHYWTDVLQN
jgi:hypothetical protein